MPRTVCEHVHFADAIAIDEVIAYEVVHCDRLRIAHRQRVFLHRPAYWTPYVDDSEAMLEQLVGFIGKEIAHALRSGLHRVVIMCDLDRTLHALLAGLRHRAIADVVIEDVNLDGAGQFLHHPLHLGIVDRADFIGIVEIRDLTLLMRENDALAVKGELREHRARIVNRHGELRITPGARLHALGRTIDVAHGPLLSILEIIQRCVHGFHDVRLHRAAVIWLRRKVAMKIDSQELTNLGDEILDLAAARAYDTPS